MKQTVLNTNSTFLKQARFLTSKSFVRRQRNKLTISTTGSSSENRQRNKVLEKDRRK